MKTQKRVVVSQRQRQQQQLPEETVDSESIRPVLLMRVWLARDRSPTGGSVRG